MLKNLSDFINFNNISSNIPCSFIVSIFFLAAITENLLIHAFCFQLPQKIFNISKTNQELPVVQLSNLSPELSSVSLVLDSGSSQLAIFDDQCDQCSRTLSVCPQLKAFGNETYVPYLLTQLKGDFSYMMLGKSIRVKFFCVLKIEGNQQSLEANGILGLSFHRVPDDKIDSKEIFNNKKASIYDAPTQESNGVNIWKKIMSKVYSKELEQLKNINQKIVEPHQNQISLKYSILYSQYHTNLIFGNVPQFYLNQSLIIFSLTDSIYTDRLSFTLPFLSNQPIKICNEEIILYLDTGSSVIVLPSQIANDFIKQLNNLQKNSCDFRNHQIMCSKKIVNRLIQSQCSLEFSIFQKNHNNNESRINLAINILNLVQKPSKKDDQKVALKIMAHSLESSQFIILGVPFFKQYLVHFSIPFASRQVSENLALKSSQKQAVLYSIQIFQNQPLKNKNQFPEYNHLIKKYDKNIKIFTFFYIFFTGLFSYFSIKLYWWIQQFIKGKRQLV